MRLTTTLIYTLPPVFALAGGVHDLSASRVRHAKRAHTLNVVDSVNNTGYTSRNPPYKVQVHYSSGDFFNDWVFYNQSDPTHGLVNYQSRDEALAKKLISVESGVTILAVDTSPTLPSNGKRDSVRISTKQKWDRGLFIADFAFMPHGCSVWPAYWSVGSPWPDSGEIDILEGVHNQPKNQYTLHTGIPCALPSDGEGIDASGSLIWYNCQSQKTDNRGCGFYDPGDDSYGAGFNAAGGGVVAHEVNDDHIRIWRFSRDEIPNDIKAQRPDPTSWGQPVAAWSSQYCDIDKAITQHSLVLDITLCGDWAGPAFAQSGCPGTCEQAIADPSNLVDARWEINYITVFQS